MRGGSREKQGEMVLKSRVVTVEKRAPQSAGPIGKEDPRQQGKSKSKAHRLLGKVRARIHARRRQKGSNTDPAVTVSR